MNFRCCNLLCVLLLLISISHAADRRKIIAIKGGTIIDGTGNPPIIGGVIIVKGDRITDIGKLNSVKIPSGAQVVNAEGKYILPGLIDCHAHMEMVGLGDLAEMLPEWKTPDKIKLLTEINAKLDLLGGITTVRDLGSSGIVFKVRDEINHGKIPGPRIIAAGKQLVKKSKDAYRDSSFVEYEGAQDAKEKVREQMKLGAEVIKIRLTNQRPMPSLRKMRAMTEEAHRLGCLVAVHTDVPADSAVVLAIESGVNSIEHNAPLRVKDSTLLMMMAKRRISNVEGGGALYVQRLAPFVEKDFADTTLEAFLDSPQKTLLPKEMVTLLRQVLEKLREQTNGMIKDGWNPRQVQTRYTNEIHRARRLGVMLGFGDDCGAEMIVHGEQYKELYGESQLGSTPLEVILMATRDAAKILGRSKELGTLQKNKLADLIIVDENPLTDLRKLRKINLVFKSGVMYNPDEILPPNK